MQWSGGDFLRGVDIYTYFIEFVIELEGRVKVV